MNKRKGPAVDLTDRLKDTVFRKDYGEALAKYDLALAVLQARRLCGLTQQEAGSQAGVSQAYLSKLESGEANPTIGHIGAILGAWWQRLTMSVRPLMASTEVTQVVLSSELFGFDLTSSPGEGVFERVLHTYSYLQVPVGANLDVVRVERAATLMSESEATAILSGGR